ncbi:MAG TPA: hypothetical protein VK090_03705 [Paracoccaceae bacterium]|nr:hypothetical protein [Paracoccaceae bacterium]
MANSSIDPGKRDENIEDPKDTGPETPGGENDIGPEPIGTRGDEEPVPDAETRALDLDGELDDTPEVTTPETGALVEPAEPIEDEFAEPHDVAPGDAESSGFGDGRRSDDDGYGEESGPSFAGRALMLLIFALVIFGLSLWIVPNVAPHLPSGIAHHLTPGQVELDNRLARLDERIETGIEDTAGELSALRQENAALAERLEEAMSTAGSADAPATDEIARAEQAAIEAGEVAAAVSRETATLGERIAGLEDQLAGLSDQFQAVNESLASGAEDGEVVAPELAAALAALQSEVKDLRERIGDGAGALTSDQAGQFVTTEELNSARDAMLAEIHEAVQGLPPADAIAAKAELQALREEAEGAVGLLAERIEEVRTTATDAAEAAQAAEQAASSAVGRVDDAIMEARIRAVAASLDSRLATGTEFAEALSEAATLTNSTPPEELAHLAETGVPTVAELRTSFARPARNAIEASIEEESGGGILGQARARVGSVLAGRPAGEQEGESVEAILSRVDARLRENEAEAALAEAETLPEPAQQALGQWLEKLRDHVAASAAAREWLTPADATSGTSDSDSDKGEG